MTVTVSESGGGGKMVDLQIGCFTALMVKSRILEARSLRFTLEVILCLSSSGSGGMGTL
jgi:hypothetical protein